MGGNLAPHYPTITQVFMDSATINFEHNNDTPGFYWLTIRCGTRAIGSIARNIELDKEYYLQVNDACGNTCHAKHYPTIERAKQALYELPLSILPMGGEYNASGAKIAD